MRIAMLLHRTAEHDSRVLREAAALAEAGQRVTIIHQPSGPSAVQQLPSGVRLVPARRGGARPKLPFGLNRLLQAADMVRRCIAERPDCVHAHDFAMLGPGWIASRLGRALLVYDSHELATGVPYWSRRWSLLVRVVERLLIGRADAVITVSGGIADRLHDRYGLPARPVVVRNTCDLPPPRSDEAPDLRGEFGGASDEPLILHQGAIGTGRGADVLVDAVARLDRGRVLFLGALGVNGEEPAAATALRRRAGDLGLADRIVLLPPAPLETLLSHTAQADVGISLLQETCENHRFALPNKVFEYLAAGVPVVTSDLPELGALLIETGAGATAEGSDPAAVAAAIDGVLSNADAFRERAAEAGSRLSWDRERHRLLELYGGLSGAAAKPEPPTAVVLVRNTASHDSRVLRVARSLLAEGERVAVVAVGSAEQPARQEEIEGVTVLRLSPRTPLRWLRPQRGPARSPSDAATAVTRADASTTRTRVSRLLRTLSYYRRAIATLRRWRPRIVHCNDYNTMWVGVAAKLLWGAAVVYDSHELWPDRNGRSEPRAWLIACEAAFVRVADRVLTTSPGHAEAMARRYRTPMPIVVRNLPERSSNGQPPADPTRDAIVYAGAITAGRGLEQAIEALAQAPGVRLVALGPGPEASRGELLGQAKRSGVADRFELAPPVAPGEVISSISGCAAGLALYDAGCRSYELGLPNKLFEYLAAGLPVLASDLPVMGPLVAGSNLGLVVPPNDVGAIARAMLELTDPKRSDPLRRAAAAARDEFSWERERERLAAAHRAAIAAAA